jgi:large subunit ribosomal protein L31
MKKDGFHPQVFEIEAHCYCGNKFVTTSTQKEIGVEICSKCHPFFSGVQKFVDSAGRIERFNARYVNPTGKK